ncbi:MAG: two-component system sensor histidine kinase QseC [Oceanicoccus sp.]|jgi:two-component system sensor histidine kinase QseC
MIVFVKRHITSSINRFLMVGILSFTIIYISAVYILSQKQSVHEIEELFDAQLAHSSFILMNLLSESVSTIDQNSEYLPIVYHGFDEFSLPSKNALFYQKKVAYQIYNQQEQLLVISGSAPNLRLADQTLGYSNIEIHGETWRVFSLYDDDWNFWLHVAESASIRDELAHQIARQTLWPSLALLPIALLLLTCIIRSALKPLKQLTLNIKKRDPKNLSAIELEHTPKEMKPVLVALNSLFTRLNDAISREQRLTADAAHELRTPLSVVMLHAQNAMAAVTQKDRDDALQQLELGVKRVSRLLEQLLTLSKVSPEIIPKNSVVFYPLCQEVMAQMAVAIMDKEQDLELICADEDQALTISGSEFLLEILLRNLLDNAREYSPAKGCIKIHINRQDDLLRFQIEDSGLGVDDNNIQRLTDRFYREHQNKGKGAGLGLSLVRSIVEFHQGDMSFSRSALGGLSVTILISLV